MTLGRCAAEWRVTRHFEGRLAPVEERELRAHLPGCAACRTRYQRHLRLEALDPAALGPKARIGRGLGVLGEGDTRRVVQAIVGGLALAAAVLLVVLGAHRRGHAAGDSTGSSAFASRGGTDATACRFVVYRASSGGEPERAGDSIARSDELAFSYENGGEATYLLIFAVDEHRHVFWYHPAWSDAAEDPASIRIQTTPGSHALHEAIRHELDGEELEIHALFTREPLTVRAVERRLASGGPALEEDGTDATLRLRVELTP
jgi:hypothetical protein